MSRKSKWETWENGNSPHFVKDNRHYLIQFVFPTHFDDGKHENL
mgnify:CR=1|jgi:hypothetical protein